MSANKASKGEKERLGVRKERTKMITIMGGSVKQLIKN